MGTYDLLKDPTVITPGWQYVCYTNNKDLKSDVWEIFYMNLQDVKQVRKVKIITPFEYDTCIWVDASIEIQCNLDDFVRDYHSTYFTIMRHPYRNCTYMEAEACIQRRTTEFVTKFHCVFNVTFRGRGCVTPVFYYCC